MGSRILETMALLHLLEHVVGARHCCGCQPKLNIALN
jgi:hypothetical protein